jgi:hypothetical protein
MNACQVVTLQGLMVSQMVCQRKTMTMIFAKVQVVARQRLGNLQGDQSKE